MRMGTPPLHQGTHDKKTASQSDAGEVATSAIAAMALAGLRHYCRHCFCNHFCEDWWGAAAPGGDSGQLAYLGASIVFSGLIVALIKIFFDQVLLGIVQRKSKRVIAEELGVLVAQVAVGVAADGLISAAASAGSSSDSQAGGISSGGGGDFGGGGASGRF